MIYHVEYENEGYYPGTLHISANLDLAYSILMDSKSTSDDRRLTVIKPSNGEEVITFWASKNPSVIDIQKGIDKCFS